MVPCRLPLPLVASRASFVAGRAPLEQALHPLHDDPGLAGPSPGDDDHRPLAPFDDPSLVGREGRRGRGDGHQ